jgi:hypothetical protein
MRSRRAWLRFVSLVGIILRWKAEEGGGGSIGFSGEALSTSVEIGEEVEEGVIVWGLLREGVRETVRSGRTFGFSEEKESTTISAVGKESILIGKVEGNFLLRVRESDCRVG